MSGFSGYADANNVKKTDIVNNCASTATDAPLSAAQGKALNDKINNKTEWKSIYDTTDVSVGNTYASTGKSFTLPKMTLVRVDMAYSTGRPLALGVKISESAASYSMGLVSVVASDISDTSGLTVTTLLPAGTYYIWARTASANGVSNFHVYGVELGA